MGSKPVRSDFRFLTSVPCPWQAWQRPTLPSLRDLVPLAQESLTAEFGMGSGSRLHTRPIDWVVYLGSSGRPRFEVGFPLRCFQRLSRPHIATLHCGWRHNSSTRGASIPVLSY